MSADGQTLTVKVAATRRRRKPGSEVTSTLVYRKGAERRPLRKVADALPVCDVAVLAASSKSVSF